MATEDGNTGCSSPTGVHCPGMGNSSSYAEMLPCCNDAERPNQEEEVDRPCCEIAEELKSFRKWRKKEVRVTKRKQAALDKRLAEADKRLADVEEERIKMRDDYYEHLQEAISHLKQLNILAATFKTIIQKNPIPESNNAQPDIEQCSSTSSSSSNT